MTAPARDAKSLFGQALEFATTAQRAAFLEEACAANPALRSEVEGLLEALDKAGSFMNPAAPPPGSVAAPFTERPGKVIGPYKLIQQIGEGGMGLVFAAEQTEPVRRTVALKIMKPALDSAQIINRFQTELQALCLMDHPNIAKVLDAGTILGHRNQESGVKGRESADATPDSCLQTPELGRPYFVMELVKGSPITQFCDQSRLTPRQRLELFIPVCQAIQHAHQKGIIHRDIKPSNVLVAMYDGKPVPKVIDFGIAKATDQRLTEKTLFTMHGQVVGTFEYMSPEQATLDTLDTLDVDTRSDVYSLGVLLYELLTGTTPLEKDRLRQTPYAEILRLIRQEDPPRPSNRLSSSAGARSAAAAYRGTESQSLPRLLRGELDWIVMKCLDKDRKRRYDSASGLARDIERYLRDEPVQACPPSAWYRVRKFARRNKTGVMAAAVLLLGLFGAGLGAIWYQGIAHQEALKRDLAEQAIQIALDEAEQPSRELHAKLADPVAVNEMIGDVEGWKAKLDRARASWQRSSDLAAGSRELIDPNLLERVKTVEEILGADEADWRLAKAIDQIRLEASKWTGHNFAYSKAARKYAKLFGDLGFAFSRREASVFGDWTRRHRLRYVLVAGLDQWAEFAAAEKYLPAILDAARLADPDPWRDQVRDAKNWQDRRLLEELLVNIDFSRQSPHILVLLSARLGVGDKGEAKANLLRTALLVHPKDFWLNFILGTSSKDRGEQLGCYRAALASRPDNVAVYVNLGNTFHEKRDFDAAIRHYRKAIEIDPTFAWAYTNLGQALYDKNDVEGAICQHLTAVELDPNDALAHNNLGLALFAKKDLDGAIRHHEKAIEIEPNYAIAHNNLGNAVSNKWDMDRAIQHYLEAIKHDPNLADPYCNLGEIYRFQGEFAKALQFTKRGHALGSAEPYWPHPSRRWVKECEQLLELDQKITAILEDKAQASDQVELIELAEICRRYKKHYATAAAFYAEAFSRHPKTADDLLGPWRFLAATCATRAALGQGKDAAKLDEVAKSKLRRQALEWLQADVKLLAEHIKSGRPKSIVQAARLLQQRQTAPELAGVREPNFLQNLANDERQFWDRVWADVGQLQKHANDMFKETRLEGKLTGQQKIHEVKWQAAKTYVIDLESKVFDTFLILEDARGNKLDENDDIGPENQNSRLIFTPREDGSYRVVVTAFQGQGTGPYTLTIREFQETVRERERERER